MLFDLLWAYFDVGAVISIGSALVAVIKYGRVYVKSLMSDLESIHAKLDNLHSHQETIEINMLKNDLSLMIASDFPKKDVLDVYDVYKAHGGNTYISTMVDEYLLDEEVEV